MGTRGLRRMGIQVDLLPGQQCSATPLLSQRRVFFQLKCSAATLDSEGNFNLGSDLDLGLG